MTDWRETRAADYDVFVAKIDEALVTAGELEAMCEELGEPKMAAETRALASGIRAVRNDLVSRARELRRHQDVDVLPMSLTTRNVRP
jgi:hypothetical protein